MRIGAPTKERVVQEKVAALERALGAIEARAGSVEAEWKDLAGVWLEEKDFEGLTIRLKAGNKKVKLKLREGQKKILEEIQKALKERKPVMQILLKARQFGGSTFYVAVLYLLVVRYGFRCGIMGQDLDAANGLWKIWKTFLGEEEHEGKEGLPRVLKKGVREYEMSNGGYIWIGSSGVAGARSKTFNAVLVTELPKWEGDVEEQLLGLLNTVSEGPESFVFIESSANGFEEFYRRWQAASDVPKRSDYVPIFVGWLEASEEYWEAFAGDREREAFMETLDEEEMMLSGECGASPEQMLWRRRCIANKCGGSVENFHQEYPTTPGEAFLQTGRGAFDKNRVQQWLLARQKPIWEGELKGWAGVDWVKAREDVEERARGLEEKAGGRMKVWEWPEAWEDYEMGVDVSEGIEHERDTTDDSAVAVFKRKNKKMVMAWRGKVPPEVLGDMLECWGMFYWEAFVCVECNNHGLTTLTRLNGQYPRHRIYHEMRGHNEGYSDSSAKLGFYSSKLSKNRLMDGLAVAIREDTVEVHDERTLLELLECTLDRAGRVETGGRDSVMALALAIEAHTHACDYNRKPVPKTPYDEYKAMIKEDERRANRQEWVRNRLSA